MQMNPFSDTGAQLHPLQKYQQQQQPTGCHTGNCRSQLAAEFAAGVQYPQGGSTVPHQKDKSNNRTGYRGVRQRAWGMFAAEIRDGAANKRRWVGTYPSSELAAKAYDAAALILHGFKAKTNFAYEPSIVEMYKVPKGDAAAAEALLADIAAGRNLPVPQGPDHKCSRIAAADSDFTTRQVPASSSAAAPANAHCNDVSWHRHSRSSSQEGHAPPSNAGTPSSSMQQATVFGTASDSPTAAAGLAQLLLHPDVSWMLQMHTAATAAAALAVGRSYHGHASAVGLAGVDSCNVFQADIARQVLGLQDPTLAGSTVQGLEKRTGSVTAACNMDAHEQYANVNSPLISSSSSCMAGEHAQGAPVPLAIMAAHSIAADSLHHSSAECSFDAAESDVAQAAALPCLVGSSRLAMQQAALAARLRASGSCDLMVPRMAQLPSVATTVIDPAQNCMEVSPAGINQLPQLVQQEQLQQQLDTVATEPAVQVKQDQPQEHTAPLTADQAIAATALLGSLFKLDFQQRSRMLEGLISTGLFAAKKGRGSNTRVPGHPDRSAASAQQNTACAQQHVAAAAGVLLQQATAGYASHPAAAGELGSLACAAMQGEVDVQLGAKRGLTSRESGGSENSSGAIGKAFLPSAKRMKQLGACRKGAVAATGEAAAAGVPQAELADPMALQALAGMAAMLSAASANL